MCAAGQDLKGRARPELRSGVLQGLGQVADGDHAVQVTGLVDQHQGDPGDQEQPGRRDQRRAHQRLHRLPAGWRRRRRGNRLFQPVLVLLHTLSCWPLARRPGVAAGALSPTGEPP